MERDLSINRRVAWTIEAFKVGALKILYKRLSDEAPEGSSALCCQGPGLPASDQAMTCVPHGNLSFRTGGVCVLCVCVCESVHACTRSWAVRNLHM